MKLFWGKVVLDNIFLIDSLISIIVGIASIGVTSATIINVVLRLKLKYNQFKYLNMPIDNQTKKSMKYYVSTRVQDIDPCTKEEYINCSSVKVIPFFIKKVFKDSAEKYFIILADSGMGKTTFLLKLFLEYYKKIFRRYNIVLVALSLDCAITKIREVENKPNTILLLDSFDEDSQAMENYIHRLKEICNETELFYKVIMTCRTQFFSDSDSEPKNTGKIKFGIGNKSVNFIKYYISPFSDKEIKKYLRKKYNIIFERKKIIKSKKIIANCPKLMVRPMLLSYMDDLIKDTEKEYNHVYEIYCELVSKWIEREAIENEILYQFSEEIAKHMYSKKTVYITQDEIDKLCNKYNIQLKSIEAKSKSLLNRNSDGIYKFAHKSILEYFLAMIALNNIEFRRTININGFDSYEMTKFFLDEMGVVYTQNILKENKIELKSGFFSFFPLTDIDFAKKKIVRCDFEGCRFVKINFLNTVFENVRFINANLSEASFLGADLTKTNFMGANLVRADLRVTDLREVNLMRADLTSAKLQGADLGGADLKEAVLREADLRSIILSTTCIREINSEIIDSGGKQLIGSNLAILDLEADLSGADLEGSIWLEEDIKKAVPLLKKANFTFIITVDKDEKIIKNREQIFLL